MNYQQPQPVQNDGFNMPEPVRNIGNNITSSLENVSNNINESIKDFSDKTQAAVESGTEASSGFLESNSLFAKFAFVILIVIVFIFLLSLGIMLINYLFSSSDNPYLVKGMIDGNDGLTIPQDPGKSDAVAIKRSNNENEGMEFTWSIWVYINELNNGDKYQQFQHIFNKGNDSYDVNGVADVNNAPGLYIKQKVSGNNTDPNTVSLYAIMDSKSGKTNNHENTKEIEDIPLKKWVNVIIRMKNTLLEVYVNGVVSGRLTFREMPMQNYHDVHICKNGGINGKISNLRYYSKALNIFDINSIVSAGPDLRSFNVDKSKMKNYNYLSNLWYTSKLY